MVAGPAAATGAAAELATGVSAGARAAVDLRRSKSIVPVPSGPAGGARPSEYEGGSTQRRVP